MNQATSEIPVLFPVGNANLVGILHLPALLTRSIGVLVVVGGPQYRAGSHRQFVSLARALSGAGNPVLRFDVRGMGDSEGTSRSFERLDEDIAAAIIALMNHVPTLEGVVLWGLCDGASASLLYLANRDDDRVRGMVLVNPWIRSEQTLARAQVKHYYLKRLREREFWVKLFSGQVAGQALRGLLGNLKRTFAVQHIEGGAGRPFQDRMRDTWSRFNGPVLLVLSGNDYTAKEFIELCSLDQQWSCNLRRSNVKRIDLTAADHTFSNGCEQQSLEQESVRWLSELSGPLRGAMSASQCN